MAKLKALPVSQLDKLVRENKPVYVINTSVLPSGDKGMVIVNFFDGNRREFFKMPPTFIPMAITDSIPPRQLIESKDFKQSLLKGMLTLVDPDSAEAFLSTTDAQEEYEALVLSEHSAAAQHININKLTNKRTRMAHHTGEGSGPMQDISAVDTVSNKVRGLIESMLAETLTTKEVLTQLRRHQSALQAVDFSYVIANTTDPDLKKWAKVGLSRAADEDEDDEDEVELEVPRKKIAAKEVKVKKKSEAKVEKYDKDVFDFEGEGANDIKAQQEATKNQALYGQSKIDEEIDNMLKGR